MWILVEWLFCYLFQRDCGGLDSAQPLWCTSVSLDLGMLSCVVLPVTQKKPSKSGMSSQRASWLRCICIKSSLICNFNHLQIWFRCSLSYFAVRLMSSNILKSSKFNFWEAETRECLLLLLKDDLNQQLSINQSNFIYTLLFKQTKSVLQGIEKKLKTIEKVILKTELKNFQDRNNIWIVTIIKVKINI